MSPTLLGPESPFSQDVRNRAKYYLDNFISMGSYTDSCGVKAVTENIARFITERDGVSCDPTDIITSNGASSAISIIMSIIANGEKTGYMIP